MYQLKIMSEEVQMMIADFGSKISCFLGLPGHWKLGDKDSKTLIRRVLEDKDVSVHFREYVLMHYCLKEETNPGVVRVMELHQELLMCVVASRFHSDVKVGGYSVGRYLDRQRANSQKLLKILIKKMKDLLKEDLSPAAVGRIGLLFHDVSILISDIRSPMYMESMSVFYELALELERRVIPFYAPEVLACMNPDQKLAFVANYSYYHFLIFNDEISFVQSWLLMAYCYVGRNEELCSRFGDRISEKIGAVERDDYVVALSDVCVGDYDALSEFKINKDCTQRLFVLMYLSEREKDAVTYEDVSYLSSIQIVAQARKMRLRLEEFVGANRDLELMMATEEARAKRVKEFKPKTNSVKFKSELVVTPAGAPSSEAKDAESTLVCEPVVTVKDFASLSRQSSISGFEFKLKEMLHNASIQSQISNKQSAVDCSIVHIHAIQWCLSKVKANDKPVKNHPYFERAFEIVLDLKSGYERLLGLMYDDREDSLLAEQVAWLEQDYNSLKSILLETRDLSLRYHEAFKRRAKADGWWYSSGAATGAGFYAPTCAPTVTDAAITFLKTIKDEEFDLPPGPSDFPALTR